MSEPNACCQEWREECNKHLSCISNLERQVAALTKERDEYSNELKHGALPSLLQLQDQLAAAQAVNEKLREAQWRNIKHVVTTLADWAFGSKDDQRWGTAWIAMVSGLTAKDGPDFKLEALTTHSDTTALQARLAEEREKCAVAAWTHYADVCKRKGLNPHHHGEWIASTAIRSMK